MTLVSEPMRARHRTRWRRAASLMACVLLLATSVPAEPTAAEKETARKLVKSGRAKHKQGDAAAALADFEAAHAIMGVPTTGLELGKAQLAVGLLVEARDTLLAVSRSSTARGEPRVFAKARADAKTLAAAVEPRIPQLSLRVVSAPTDVRISVDDREVPEAALSAPLSLNPGQHVIVARSDGREKQAEVSLSEGESRTLELDLTELAPPPTPTPDPTAQPEKPSKGGRSPWVTIGFGVAGAGVLVGSVTGVLALSKSSSAKEDCVGGRCPPSTHDDIDSGRTLGSVSTIAFIIGGVGAGIGTYALLGASDEPSAEPRAARKARLDAFISPSSVGVRGQF